MRVVCFGASSRRFGLGAGRWQSKIPSFSTQSFLEMGRERPREVKAQPAYDSVSATFQLCDLEELSHPFVPQFPHIEHGNSRTLRMMSNNHRG